VVFANSGFLPTPTERVVPHIIDVLSFYVRLLWLHPDGP